MIVTNRCWSARAVAALFGVAIAFAPAGVAEAGGVAASCRCLPDTRDFTTPVDAPATAHSKHVLGQPGTGIYTIDW